jgi:hypothetical protein
LYQANAFVRCASLTVVGKIACSRIGNRAAVAAVDVEHADEGRGGEQGEVVGGEEEGGAEDRKRAQRDEERALVDAGAGAEREERGERGAPERARQDDADLLRRKPEARGVEPMSTAIRPMASARRNAATRRVRRSLAASCGLMPAW